ncbi:MAG: hypothetical protein BroJett030_28970 [Alphaproteobacteria bacterium]|nr:MAG: hypothetical protein BroJett030_28970 [Alphaproteobacteria bacterium]
MGRPADGMGRFDEPLRAPLDGIPDMVVDGHGPRSLALAFEVAATGGVKPNRAARHANSRSLGEKIVPARPADNAREHAVAAI